MVGTALTSPVKRLPAAPERPRATAHGLEGVDSTFGLRYVNLGCVPSPLQKHFRPMFASPQGLAQIFFFAAVHKAAPGRGKGAPLAANRRVLVVGSAALYLCRATSLVVSRCIPVTMIERLILGGDNWCGVGAPKQYDMLFRLETEAEVQHLAQVLRALCRALQGRELPVRQLAARGSAIRHMLNLSKPSGWSTAQSERVLAEHPIAVIDRNDLEAAAALSPEPSPQLPSGQVCYTELRAASPAGEAPPPQPAPPPQLEPSPSKPCPPEPHPSQPPAGSAVPASPCRPSLGTEPPAVQGPGAAPGPPLLPPQALAAAQMRNRELRVRLRQAAEVAAEDEAPTLAAPGAAPQQRAGLKPQRALQAHAAAAADMRRLSGALALHHQPALQDAGAALRQRVQALRDAAAGAGASRRQLCSELAAAQIGLRAAEEERLFLVAQLSRTESVGDDAWERQAALEAQAQALVARAGALAAERAELARQLEEDAQRHAEGRAGCGAAYSAHLCALKEQLAALAEQRAAQLQELEGSAGAEGRDAQHAGRLDCDRRELEQLQGAVAAAARQRAELEQQCNSLRALAARSLSPAAGGAARAAHSPAAGRCGGRVVAAELRDANDQLTAALERIAALEREAAAAPQLRASIEGKERERQRLDLEVQELLEKLRGMKRAYETRLGEAQMEAETRGLRIRALRAAVSAAAGGTAEGAAPRARPAAAQQWGAAEASAGRPRAVPDAPGGRPGAPVAARAVSPPRRAAPSAAPAAVPHAPAAAPAAPDAAPTAPQQLDEQQQPGVAEQAQRSPPMQGTAAPTARPQQQQQQQQLAEEEEEAEMRRRLAAVDSALSGIAAAAAALAERERAVAQKRAASLATMQQERAAGEAAGADLRRVDENIARLEKSWGEFTAQRSAARQAQAERAEQLRGERERIASRLAQLQRPLPAPRTPPSAGSAAAAAASESSAEPQELLLRRAAPHDKWGITCSPGSNEVAAVAVGSPAAAAGLATGARIAAVYAARSAPIATATQQDVYDAFGAAAGVLEVTLLVTAL
eukprot:TRINITY_DN3537_c1_g3_i1.p1 TRINITY_DN3537_c1_g3~~TRINITY_DN3537_c1_g3_i1.p1  ORF type:complete len:1065 (+),score=340.03 TRINITY_DN3537_c1_g3_i1:72-3197(+)